MITVTDSMREQLVRIEVAGALEDMARGIEADSKGARERGVSMVVHIAGSAGVTPEQLRRVAQEFGE